LRQTFATRSLAGWAAFLAPLDVAWAPVRTLHEAVHSEHAAARAMRVEQPAGQPHLGLPIKFAQEPGQLHGRLEELGASTAQVLFEAGFSQEQLAALHPSGAFGFGFPTGPDRSR
jgi:crotonobetainyl-CoA:carnitine CoA-transferase CaiB-like acyl-CoA transferase